MAELPSVTGKEAVRAFTHLGFVHVRTEGSHHILKRDGHRFLLAVPIHGNRPLKRGTLRGLIRASGHTVEEFIQALQ